LRGGFEGDCEYQYQFAFGRSSVTNLVAPEVQQSWLGKQEFPVQELEFTGSARQRSPVLQNYGCGGSTGSIYKLRRHAP